MCTSANTMALLIKRSGRYNYRILEHNDTVCSIEFREIEDGKWVEVGESTFTIEDAKRAKLVYPDSAWIKYPRAMLFSRAISQGARLYAPDAIGGVYTSEEIKSIDGTMTDEPVTVTTEPNTNDNNNPEHWCDEHNTTFFKKGKMRSYAHPIDGSEDADGKKLWCYEHTTKPQTTDAPVDLPDATEENHEVEITSLGDKKQKFTTVPEKPNPLPDVAQAEQDIKDLWPGEPQPTAEPTDPAVTVIGKREPYPICRIGTQIKVRETGDIQEYQKGGKWVTIGNEPFTEPFPEPEPDEPKTKAEFFKWLQGKGRKYGPSWFYKQFNNFTAETMKDESNILQAYAEVKEIMGW